MMLQKTWDAIGGTRDPVRRNRKAQWKPKSVVYAVWNTASDVDQHCLMDM